jgi:serine/threonine-protein phosphatase 2A regulatory subunit B''
MNYKQFKTAGRSLLERCQWFFKPSIFLQQFKVQKNCILISNFFSFVSRAAALVEALFTLTNYSSEYEGYLSEEEFRQYLEDLIPHLNLKPQNASLRKFYLCTALRRFTFFHDRMRQGKMSIHGIVFSQTFSELHQLRDPELCGDVLNANWFSSEYTQRVYSDFLKMDQDRNGMLNRKELSRYRNGNLTKTFLDRLFTSVQLFNGEMDYLGYLDFVLSMENMDTPEAQTWLFKVIDIKNDRFLDESTVTFFVRDVTTRMFAAGMEPIPRTDIVNEIFDLASPAEIGIITLKDIKKSGVGNIILNMLIDYLGWHQYDTRSQAEHSS